MTETSENRLNDLLALAADQCDGRLTVESALALERLVTGDRALRRHYVVFMQTDATAQRQLVAWPGKSPLDEIATGSAGAAGPAPARAEVFGDFSLATAPTKPASAAAASRSLYSYSFVIASVVLAAVLLTSSFVYLRHVPEAAEDGNSPPVVAQLRPPVATLTETADCEWQGMTKSIRVGEVLRPGRMELTAGRAQITFDSGAHVILQAPTTVELVSQTEATLIEGSVTADVPPEARGFTVATFAGRCIDLGTEFGVGTRGDAVDVYVFEGTVAVEPAPADDAPAPEVARKLLRAGQSLRMWRDAARPMEFVQLSSSRFARRVAVSISTFDKSTEGWHVESRFPNLNTTGDTKHEAQRWNVERGYAAVSRLRAGDAHAGFIRTGDEAAQAGCFYFCAPRTFAGNQSESLGKSFQYQIRIHCVDERPASNRNPRFHEVYPNVLIAGGGKTIVANVPEPEFGEWTDVRIPLGTEGGWKIVAPNDISVPLRSATEEDLRQVLRRVKDVRIRGEFTNVRDEADLDNVVFGK